MTASSKTTLESFCELPFENQQQPGMPVPTPFSAPNYDMPSETQPDAFSLHVEKLWCEWESFFGLLDEERRVESTTLRSKNTGSIDESKVRFATLIDEKIETSSTDFLFRFDWRIFE